MHRVEQPGEVLAPGPAFGRVEGEAAGGAGQTGGQVDQAVADRGGGRFGVEVASQSAGGTGEMGREGEPGGIRQECSPPSAPFKSPTGASSTTPPPA